MSEKLNAQTCLKALFDEETFYQLKPEADNSVIVGTGLIYGTQCYAFAQNSGVNDGAMSSSHAEKILKIYELAEKTGSPVIGFFDSNGGDLKQGICALDAYSRVIEKSNRLSGVVPQIAIINGVCAASSAVWALNNDIVICSGNAELFVNSPFVTGNDKVGKAENAVKNGTAHIAVDSDDEAVSTARELIALLPANNLSVPADFEAFASGVSLDTDCVDALADDQSRIELRAGFGTETKTYLARVNGISAGIVNVKGTITADDSRKVCSLVGLCDAYSLPVVTIVDTEGFDSSVESEFYGAVKASAALSKCYAEATTVKLTVINGKAYGTSFVIFAGKNAGADYVFATNKSVIAPINPDAAAVILDDTKISEIGKDAVISEYIKNEATAENAAKLGLIDEVCDSQSVVGKVYAALDMLLSKRTSTLDKKHTIISF